MAISTMLIDKKTGRKRRKDMKRSRQSIKAARKRKGKKQKAATIAKRKRSVAKARRTGKTKYGRRARF